VEVAALMNGKLMLSLLRSNPHKEHLVTELPIRGVTGIDASMKWNQLCKLMKEHEKNIRGCFTPMSDLFKQHREDILLQYSIKTVETVSLYGFYQQ
jgi:hypothetical protein